ncbi:hybrid sensor histidine kinase/response regulator [Desulfoluna butyratoxydans]|uniref:histidine kinase n=1 Tax=Desulfoluna butyratoxydans TaxID=231438 RepID=A0A4U8YSL6_9BACT|nr:chemotaxis protein CheW [Desulfoluna butyratoxydans]VFQ44283.1 signal transduction response regulator receiver domain [Desulfoluna butyratoxydans]
MIFEDDDTLRMYVEESLEHLSDIESDLLAIEEAGLENGEELINNVFRAAHSIKGGAGFMGLTTVKELSHNLENVLNMMRNGELDPAPAVISTLLTAFDKLTDLVNNIETSNEADITTFVDALVAIDSLPEAPAEPEAQAPAPPATEDDEDPLAAFEVDREELDKFLRQGKYVYRLTYDLNRDIADQGKVVNEVLNTLGNSGMILDSTDPTVPADAKGDRPFLVLFASIIEPDIAPLLAELDESAVEDITPLLGGGDAAMDQIIEEAESAAAPAAPSAPAPAEPSEPVAAPAPQPVPQAVPTPVRVDEHEAKPMEMETRSKGQTSIRVNLELLDTLMTLAGELVLSRNQLMQGITGSNTRAVETSGQRIDMITSELQEAIMRTRMQPISNVFNKFTRVVRDLAGTLNKKVDLFIEGKDVELDKTIIESINDPLTHLVRNSVDHGIESPEDRARLGKNPTGRIFLKAFHEAGQVNIEISDDGGGIDGDAIAAAAIRKGLLSESDVAVMGTKEKVGLIFLPGFSTARQVTDVSGRGVGMDVVKTNLDKLGGIIDIHSKPGKGTTILIKLPLTLAIIPSQIVSVENERYAIPQVNLDELLRIPAAQVKDRIEKVGNADVVRLRGALLPLLRLTDLLDIAPTFVHPEDGKVYPDKRRNLADRRQNEDDLPEEIRDMRSGEDRRYRSDSAINIAVVSAGNFKYGLVVDELRDSEEIVVKPLGRHLSKCDGYAGATIMGDGRVALILDVASLAKMGSLNETSSKTISAAEEASANERNNAGSDRTALLTFKGGEAEHFAAPLNLVERIERIKSDEIEEVGGRRVIQYRGGTLPLNEVSEVANVAPVPESDQYEVVVFRVGGRETGLLVTPPVDAVEVDLNVDASTLKQEGIMGSLIVGDHTTLMVDIFELVRTVNPTWFEENRPTGPDTTTTDGEIRVLFAEDSAFFRNQVSDFLADEGFIVTTAEDGAEAWNYLNKGVDDFTVILTDLEMPNMDGFELTKKIKASETFGHLPVVALTSLASERDIQKGKEAGIDSYQIKLDREKLIDVVREYSL